MLQRTLQFNHSTFPDRRPGRINYASNIKPANINPTRAIHARNTALNLSQSRLNGDAGKRNRVRAIGKVWRAPEFDIGLEGASGRRHESAFARGRDKAVGHDV